MANTEVRFNIDADLMKEFEDVCKKEDLPIDAVMTSFISAFVRKDGFPYRQTLTERLHQTRMRNYKE